MPKVPFWVIILIAIVYCAAVGVNTMDIDASQYAEMSREMLVRGDFLHVYDRGFDYLDKPPFLFWVSSLSMKMFGINNFGFKFPSILFALWALYATYRLGRLLYNDTVGRMAALVLGTCQGMFLMTNDVRCDTILMSWTVTAVWLIQEWVVSRRLGYLLAGFAAVAFGMMTKGPIALMVPVFCFVSDWVLKRQWRNFFRREYLLGLIVIAVLLIPMSIGLYQQFDLHPDKLVNGNTHVSGLRFFYWSQSFGRITGESPWKNGAGIDFLLLNMLWSYLPWILLFVAAIISNVITVVRQRFKLQPHQEWITTGGFILAYLALGSSAYQLPHYIFIVYPLASVFTARFIYDIIEADAAKGYARFFRIAQPVVAALLLLASLAFIIYIFPAHIALLLLWVGCFVEWIYLAFKKEMKGKLFWLSAAAMIIVNLFLNLHVYPTLLTYQVGSQVGSYMKAHNISDKTIAYKIEDPLNSIHFYAQHVIPRADSTTDIGNRSYVLTQGRGIADLTTAGYKADTIIKGYFYKVSELTPQFLIPSTRHEAIHPYYLVRVKG